MEISSLFGFQTITWAQELEEKVSLPPQKAQAQEAPVPGETVNEDRLEKVRSQNLASPAPEPVDLQQALVLIRQVQEQMTSLDRGEARDLYQFDRLRDLCCRVYENSEA